MKIKSFEIHSVSLKKKVYKIEIPEAAEKGILLLSWNMMKREGAEVTLFETKTKSQRNSTK